MGGGIHGAGRCRAAHAGRGALGAGGRSRVGNLRAAHRWALDHRPADAGRIVAALYWYGYFRGPAEVFVWADETVEYLDADDPSAVGALATASLGAWRRGDLARSRQLGERALALDPAPGTRFARTALRSAAGLAGDQLAASCTATPC